MPGTTRQNPANDRIRSQASLFDTATQAVIGTTLDGSIVYWNEAAGRIYGWRADEVLDRDIVEVTPSNASREQARQIMDALRRGTSWTGEFEVSRKDGTAFRSRVSDLPVLDLEGHLVGIIGVSSPL